MGRMNCEGRVPVSVIMGTLYRCADISLLKRSVESILEQTFSDLEFIICDTGSTDKASAYLEGLSDPRVKLVRKDGCLDLARKLNLCLKVASGRYIARMDDDDWSYPERLEKEFSFLEHNDDIAFVGCNVALARGGKKVGERSLPERPTVEDFYLTQPYIHPSLMFRRKAILAVNCYSESSYCERCEDYDILLRMYKAGFTGANLQEVLLDYTVSADPKCNRTIKHRINEVCTRFRRFHELGRLPAALPYVLKPLAVWLMPNALLQYIRKKCSEGVVEEYGTQGETGK